MDTISLSTDARMMLAKMSVIFEKEKGARVKLSRTEDVVGVINHAIDTINEEYKRLYQRLLDLLTPNEMVDLLRHGAHLYRGAAVPDPHPANEPPVNMAKEEVTVATYRGVPLDGGLKPSATSEPEKPANTTKRVYRGRVIED